MYNYFCFVDSNDSIYASTSERFQSLRISNLRGAGKWPNLTNVLSVVCFMPINASTSSWVRYSLLSIQKRISFFHKNCTNERYHNNAKKKIIFYKKYIDVIILTIYYVIILTIL